MDLHDGNRPVGVEFGPTVAFYRTRVYIHVLTDPWTRRFSDSEGHLESFSAHSQVSLGSQFLHAEGLWIWLPRFPCECQRDGFSLNIDSSGCVGISLARKNYPHSPPNKRLKPGCNREKKTPMSPAGLHLCLALSAQLTSGLCAIC